MSGPVGDNVYRASGVIAAAAGGGGAVSWQTDSIKVTGDSPVTGVAGEGYFMNTAAGAITLNLPAGVAGDIIAVTDYTRTFGTNTLTVAPNGAEKLGGVAADGVLNVDGQAATFVYVDSTEGWINIQETQTTLTGNDKIVATGGNSVIIDGSYKIHAFTSPGTFCVATAAQCGPDNVVDFAVMGGGGGGGGCAHAGGGGAGGFRIYDQLSPCAQTSPLNNYPSGCSVTVTATAYPIVIGAGGGGGGPGGGGPGSPGGLGANGTVSTFSTISSAGGGAGTYGTPGTDGGSGGGSGAYQTGYGSGNTPPTCPPQGQNGGQGSPSAPAYGAGGGGGAGAVGANGSGSATGPGGVGSYISEAFIGTCCSGCYGTPGPVGSTRYFTGGGGGAGYNTPSAPGGAGGGGAGAYSGGVAGTANTGGGGGGSERGGPAIGGTGGSGVVLIKYKYT